MEPFRTWQVTPPKRLRPACIPLEQPHSSCGGMFKKTLFLYAHGDFLNMESNSSYRIKSNVRTVMKMPKSKPESRKTTSNQTYLVYITIFVTFSRKMPAGYHQQVTRHRDMNSIMYITYLLRLTLINRLQSGPHP